jgi:hypothetical protein
MVKDHVKYQEAVALYEDLVDVATAVFGADRAKGYLHGLDVEDVDEDMVEVLTPYFGVTVGHLVEVSTIARTIQKPGYRVWYGKVIYNGWAAPDEVEEVTVAEVLGRAEAVQACIDLLVRDVVEGTLDAKYAEDIQREYMNQAGEDITRSWDEYMGRT